MANNKDIQRFIDKLDAAVQEITTRQPTEPMPQITITLGDVNLGLPLDADLYDALRGYLNDSL